LENQKAAKLLAGDGAGLVAEAAGRLAALDSWEPQAMESLVRDIAEHKGLGLGKIAQPLRAALTGSNVSPGIFEIMQVLGREESLERLYRAATGSASRKT
jgi:glutamyl-tRNA synthetase